MDGFTLTLVLLGVAYVSEQIMRFIVCLDGNDERQSMTREEPASGAKKPFEHWNLHRNDERVSKAA